MWIKEKGKYRWWNRKLNRPTIVVDVWRYAKNRWRASVNNSWLSKDVSKKDALNEARKYMRRIK